MRASPPNGILRPNPRALAQGLSFAQAFGNNPTQPFLTRGATVSTYQSGAVTAPRFGAQAMTGANGWWGSSSASNTYSLGTNAGTVIVYFLADHDSGSAGNRILFAFGNPTFPSAYLVAISTFFGTWYAGWADGADKRVTVSASGLYANGDLVSTALTWGPSSQIAYMQGRQIVSGAAANYGTTAAGELIIGNNNSGAFPWVQAASGGVYYAVAFDRQFTPAEIAEAAADPWWWARQPRRRPGRTPIAYTLNPEPVEYRYTPATVALTYEPAQTGDTHDGMKRRSRRQRAMDAAEQRRRASLAEEALALRLSLEAAMGMAAEVAEEAPQEAIQAATRQAARMVPALADTRPDDALLALAREAVTALLAAVQEAERTRALAEDDEDVLMLLRAL